MELKYKRIYCSDGDSYLQVNPKNTFDKKCPEQCCLTCKHGEKLYDYRKNINKVGCWHASDECGEPDHRWCQDNGDTFKCTDWIDKDAKITPELDLFNTCTCECKWDGYYDYRIICYDGIGHIRVSFYPDQVIISDLYVKEDERRKRYGTALLDYADKLIQKLAPGKDVCITPLTDWEREWYTRRGYKIVNE